MQQLQLVAVTMCGYVITASLVAEVVSSWMKSRSETSHLYIETSHDVTQHMFYYIRYITRAAQCAATQFYEL